MPDKYIFEFLLNIMNESANSAVAYVDKNATVEYASIGRKPGKATCNYKGISLARFLKLALGNKGDPLFEAYLKCVNNQIQVHVNRFEQANCYNSIDYFNWTFVPVSETGGAIICARNVSEEAYLEQEMQLLLEQSDSVTRQLHAALANIDFQLMDLDQANKKLAALYRITSIVQRTVNEQEVMEEIIEGITKEFEFPAAAILLVDEERQELYNRVSIGYEPDIRIPYGKGIAWRALLRRELIHIPDVTEEPDYVSSGNPLGEGEIALPLFLADKAIGVLDIESSPERYIQPQDITLLQSLANQVALTIVHAKHINEVEMRAITDALTGLHNYRYFIDLLDREYKRAVRYNRPLSLLMLDIDYFKHYNDTYGHMQGNEVLRQLAAILKSIFREVDYVFRYGGEEIVAILPETNSQEAYIIAERVRKAIEDYPFYGRETQPGGTLTVSIGISSYPEMDGSERQMLEYADDALYLAKKDNRNCVKVYVPKSSFA